MVEERNEVEELKRFKGSWWWKLDAYLGVREAPALLKDEAKVWSNKVPLLSAKRWR